MLEWLFGKKREEPPAPPKPSAQQQAEDKWKYDFLVQFLSGPLWKTSILDFVDYNCVVFDNEEENKFEYTVIHNKFKELVGSLFDSMVQEVGLDDDKLAELLEKGFESKNKKIFNQLLLADDFLRFKALMVNRNKALEAEALKALERSQVAEPKKEKIKQEDVILESKRAEQERRRQQLEEEEQLRKVLQMSRLEAEEKEAFSRLEQKAAENELRQSQLAKQSPSPQKAVQKEAPKEEAVKQQPTVSVSEQPMVLPPVRRRKKMEESPKVEQKVEHVEPKVQPKVEPKVQPKVEPKVQPAPVEQKPEATVEQAEVQSQEQRKRRLLEQREKIRRKKQEDRRRQAAEQELKGSQVQTIVLQEDGIHETQLQAAQEQKKEKMNNQEIERRRQLMRKIKNRIVDDF